MSKSIPLSRGCVALVDADHFEWLSHWKWSADATGYAVRAEPHGGPRRLVQMHRYVSLPSPDEEVDHINGDRLDNRRSNLRVCRRGENARNQARHRDNRSGFKGVFKHQPGWWRARICAAGHIRDLGTFRDPVDVALAYDLAAIELHGEFAHLNFLEAKP